MATLDLQSVLGAPQMTGAIVARTADVPRPFPDVFYTPTPADRVIRNTGSFMRTYGSRRNARVNAYGAPSKLYTPDNFDDVPFTCVTATESMNLMMDDYQGLISTSSTGSGYTIDSKGAELIASQLENFAAIFGNLRSSVIALTLAKDATPVDAGGNVMGSTSAGTRILTISSGVKPSNQGQLPLDGVTTATNIITTDWSNPAADIPGMLQKLVDTARALSGLPLRYAFYGSNVPGYIFKNPELQAFLSRAPQLSAQQFIDGTIPSLFGMTWLPASQATFVDRNGVLQNCFGPDRITFTPTPSADWWGLAEGTRMIPGTKTIDRSALAMVADAQQAVGLYSFAEAATDPLAIKVVVGDTFLPIVKNPNAIFQAQVSNFGTAE